MNTGELLARARRAAELSQGELAHRARTSRPTVSAYEHDRKSPTLDTAVRLLAATGHVLEATRQIEFTEPVHLPLHLNWSDPDRAFDLSDRADRARVYEIVLREGQAADITAYTDGALLVDLWDDVVLSRAFREA